MNSKIIIGVVAALVVVVAGVMFLKPERTQDSTSIAPDQQVAIDGETRVQGTGFLSTLFSDGSSLICNYTSVDDTGMENVGTMYYDADTTRFHVRNTMTDDAGEYQSGVINDGETLYTWAESAEGIFAFAVPAEPEENTPETVPGTDEMFAQPDIGATGDEQDTLNTEVTYDCVAWTVDQSVFVPPSNIEFMSPQAMLEAALEGFDPELIEVR